MAHTRSRNAQRIVRKARIRSRLSGTALRPRLSVFRGATTCYAQLIDDTKGTTLVSVYDRELSAEDKKTAPVARAHALGMLLGKKAEGKGVKSVVFDRSGYAYHGRVAALAEGARESGLIF